MEKEDVDQDKGMNQVEVKLKKEGTMAPIPFVLAHNSETSTTSEEEQCQAKAARTSRPCKGKRLRQAKFVARLIAEIREKAVSFNFEEILWPPSLQANERKRQHVIHLLRHHQYSAIDGPSRSKSL